MHLGQHYFVYILASTAGTLYIGVTNNLHRRIWQHKQGEIEGFTKKYRVNRLVYHESFDDVRNAIDREKQLKRWTRAKKIWLFERVNPSWLDLSSGWYERGPSTPLRSAQEDKPQMTEVKS
jgi:putative endonuclease